MIGLRSYSIYQGIRSAGSIRRYRVEQKSEKDITRNLLATMTLNRQQDSPHVTVPSVTVVDRTPSHLTVEIEKLAGMYDLDRLAEDVSGSFRGRLANYAVTSSRIAPNGNEFVLTLEDVGIRSDVATSDAGRNETAVPRPKTAERSDSSI